MNHSDDIIIQSEKQLTTLLTRAQGVFLETDSERAAFETLLEDTLSLTKCSFGFFAEVLYRDGVAYLKMHSISNISWNTETSNLYKSMEQEGLEFHDLDNMLGESIRTLKPTISNSFELDVRSKGTPSGHPPIFNYLGLPIFSSKSGEEIIGLIGMANKPDGYTDAFIKELAPLANLTCILIERLRLRKQNAKYNNALYQAANFDELTKLPNRRLLSEYIDNCIDDENYAESSFSVCYLDLDGFKQINEMFGHTVGDSLLKDLAKRLKNCVSSSDFISRVSGDEFVIVLHGKVAETEYQRIVNTIKQPFETEGQVFSVTASMGIAIFPDDFKDADHLIRYADQALYFAKENGKNQFCVFDREKYQERDKQQKFVQTFSTALLNDEVQLYLQPKIDLINFDIEGFEVLCRWQRPNFGLLPPDHFLPQIEGTKAAIELDQYILLSSYGLLHDLKQLRPKLKLNVNITADYFNSPEFENHLLELDKGNVKVDGLVLEIVESTALGELDQAVARLNSCKKIGFEISLDDFGTSFSSLTYFRTLPVDEVKIDKSFIQDILVDEQDSSIVKAIIDMSKSFKRKIVAEGVEEKGQVVKLQAYGCHFAQGYYFSKPMPIGQAKNYLKSFDIT